MPEDTLQRGLDWLLSQQQSDGCWRTDAFGQLKEGNASTALVVETLTLLPDPFWEKARSACQKGIDFLHPRLQSFVSSPSAGGVRIEYPVYTAALFLAAAQRRFSDATRELNRSLVSLLLKEQRTTANGWKEGRSDLGGWGAWLENPSEPGAVESANVSCTRMALQALRLSNAVTPEVASNATNFLKHCRPEPPATQTGDGFFFTPDQRSTLNKKGTARSQNDEIKAIPYLPPTCDGILSLLELAAPIEADEMQTLLRVAASMPLEVPPVPPLSEETPPSPVASVFYYGTAALGAVWKRTQSRELNPLRSKTLEILQQRQSKSGSWENPLPWFQESAPLIATSFALQAVSQLLARGER